jgi:hypothetical protein
MRFHARRATQSHLGSSSFRTAQKTQRSQAAWPVLALLRWHSPKRTHLRICSADACSIDVPRTHVHASRKALGETAHCFLKFDLRKPTRGSRHRAGHYRCSTQTPLSVVFESYERARLIGHKVSAARPYTAKGCTPIRPECTGEEPHRALQRTNALLLETGHIGQGSSLIHFQISRRNSFSCLGHEAQRCARRVLASSDSCKAIRCP